MSNEVGVFQLENGNWGYRFVITKNGKSRNRKGTKDEAGKPLKTAKQAAKARAAAMVKERELPKAKVIERKTVEEVFEEYCEKGRLGKAASTIRKQDSLWKNHLRDSFGSRFIDDITSAEVEDYLANLYYAEGKAYKYVEGFLRQFYLFFGQAYSRNYLSTDDYNRLCRNKDTKIKMPKMKTDEETDIIVFDTEELETLDSYFKGTHAETAYMLGRYCGLRLNECYGLKWSEVNLEEGTIRISRQLQEKDGLDILAPLKTRNANRTIYLSDKMQNYLKKLYNEKLKAEETYPEVRKQNQRILKDIDGTDISSLELVNTLENGKFQTYITMAYHAKQIRQKFGFHFKYHYLRHTFGTQLAEMNTPLHLLCNQMGHGNINVTRQYYLAISKSGVELLRDNLNQL